MSINSSSCFMTVGGPPSILVNMAHQTVTEEEFKRKTQQELNNTDDPLVKLRSTLLLRGTTGIKGFGRSFRIMDDDCNKRINRDEFNKGMHDFQVPLTPAECETLFKRVDTDNTGTIDFDEFLVAVRPPMPDCRVKLIDAAFAKMDKTGDGVITADDMKGVFNARKHPKFLSGEKTEKEVFELYLNSFEIGGHVDGKVTKEEFLNYYAGVSASIDDNCYFDLMMRNAWKL